MKDNKVNELRSNFYYAMGKIISFYRGYMEKKIENLNEDSTDDYYLDMYVEAHIIMEDIDRLFETPLRTIGDLIYKGKEIMELKDRIESYEYWHC